jgi:hypothetical protein
MMMMMTTANGGIISMVLQGPGTAPLAASCQQICSRHCTCNAQLGRISWKAPDHNLSPDAQFEKMPTQQDTGSKQREV